MNEDTTRSTKNSEEFSPEARHPEAGGARPQYESGATVNDPRLELELIVDRAINLSQQQCGIPVIKRIVLASKHPALIEGVRVRVEIEDEVANAFETVVDRIPPGGTISIRDLDLILKPSVLRERTERESTRIVVTAEGVALDPAPGSTEGLEGGRVLVRQVEPVEILAWNEWGGAGGLTEILATFVQPNDPFVARLLRNSREPLNSRVGDDAFDGYQAKNPDRVVNLVGAIFEGAAAFGFGYLSTAASFEEHGQKVRLPETLERDGQGNCLDLTLLLAAACEQAGLHPLLVLIEGHIVLGVWTSEESFPEATLDVASRVLNRAANREILLVESTAITQGKRADFEEAVRVAEKRVQESRNSMVAVDVHRARKLRFLPLSSRLDDRGLGENETAGDETVRATSRGASTISVPSVTAPEDAAERESPKTRVDRWKGKLLDLTLRNRLLNFKAGKKTLEFLVPDLGHLEDLLQNDKKFGVAPPPDLLKGVRDLETLRRREGVDVADRPLAEAIDSRVLCAPETTEEIEKRLTAIYREARTLEEESGSNNLFLTLGLLRWFESDTSSQDRLAPLILLPVRLDKASRGGFKLSLSGEEARPNITLLQKLRNDFRIETAGLEEFPADDSGVDVPLVLATFRDRVKDKDRWEVLDKAYLGLLQFSKFVLWRDLEQHMESLAESPVVKLLLEGSSDALRSGDPLPSARRVDATITPGDLFCPLDADSSQLAAIQAADQGRTFVLQGPPGTGKSQTITNLIAHSLANGKRVLFVAEKAAALEVVQTRLERVGLGDACLAVHSHKAGKREVLDQIKKTLDAERLPRPADWERTLRGLTQRRDELNGYVNDLHFEHFCGYSFFRVTGELSLLGEGPRVDLRLSDPLNTDPAQLDALRNAAQELEVTVREVRPIAENAFLGVGLDHWTPTVEKRNGDLAFEVATAARQLIVARSAITGNDQFVPSPIDGGVSSPSALMLKVEVSLARELLECPGTSRALLQEERFTALQGRLRAVLEAADQEREAAQGLTTRWSDSFLDLDPDEWGARVSKVQRAFVLARWVQKRALVKELSSHRQSASRELDLESARKDFRRLKEWAAARKASGDGRQLVLEYLPTAMDDHGQLDTVRAQSALSWTQRIRERLEALIDEHPAGGPLRDSFIRYAADREGARLRSASARQNLEQFIGAYEAFGSARAALVGSLRLDEDATFGPLNEGRYVERIMERADRLDAERDRLRPWTAWLQAGREARSRGLGALIQALEVGEITAEEVEATVGRSICHQIAEAALVFSSRLQRFSRDSHERRIDEFRRLDEELIAVSERMAQARCRENIPTLEEGTSVGEAGLLRRETKKQKRHMSIRRLFAELPTLLPRIKPCLLMSPLSVAQYLSPRWQADIVIFDEASQIPVPDAIGALGRGKAAVVVGDSKQLPPTAFFSKASGDEEGDGDGDTPEDLQSILEECEGSGVPSLNLGWHYRSQHESLIAFSNHHYYDNRLHTFPSAVESIRGLGVRHVHLPQAVYDKGRSATNRGEAEAIIADVVARCREGQAAGSLPSIGIVAFSKAQADLIEDLLDEKAKTEDAIELARRAKVDPLFIKNLENVQGDERDTILFSICYGPDVSGKVGMHFGPLNRQGGERRLNVAITRARKELVVFSRLMADDIDLRRTRALGAEHLKVFLDYAARGPRAIAEATSLTPNADFDSPFEKSVFDALVARGHRVDIQVGCSGYRIDLAVRHPEKAGRYVLGIECDGASYHSAATARDRDRLRQSVLESLGWQLHRIWSTDYWANARKEIDRAEAAIEAAIASDRDRRAPEVRIPAAASAPQPVVDFAGDPVARPQSAEGDPIPRWRTVPDVEDSVALYAKDSEIRYESKIADRFQPPVVGDSESQTHANSASADERSSRYEIHRGTADRHLLEQGDTAAIVEMMAMIIEVEAPIEVELLHRRAIACFGIAKLGSRIKKTLSGAHAPLARRGFRLEESVFWRSDQDSERWAEYRVATDADSQRKLDQVPVAELANALDHQLKRVFGLPADDLLRAGARTFGVASLGPTVRHRMQQALDLLVASGRAALDGDQVRLPG